jgi:hypothetical protein
MESNLKGRVRLEEVIWSMRRQPGVVLIAAVALLAAGCSSAGLTPTTPTTGASTVTITASPPTFIVGVSGTIEVKLAGSPTKTSTFKMDFGDQTSATLSGVASAAFPHTYASTGTFKVTATVTASDGSVSTGTAEMSALP